MEQYIDKELVRKRFSKALSTYSNEATVQKYIAERMNNALINFLPFDSINNVLEIGCGTGTFARIFLKDKFVDKYIMNDLCDEAESKLSDLLSNNITFVSGDAENINLPEGQDMIVSCSTIQWFNNPINFMIRCKDKLTSSGILAISSFGMEHFKEINSISLHTLKYISIETIKNYLNNFYDIIYSCEENITMYFNTPEEVLRHIKKTGANGINKEKWTKANIKDFCTKYERLFSDDRGKVRLTYNPIYLICKKKSCNEKE